MDKSESINELATALAKAQGGFPAVLKGGTNPHLKNKYATLDDVIEAVRGPLAVESLSFVQLIGRGETGAALTTMLMHSSGQFISTTADVDKLAGNRAINDMQSLGAALTYMKRYQLSAMLGLNTESDDDGNGRDAVRSKQEVPAQSPPEVNQVSVNWALGVATPSGSVMADANRGNLKYVIENPDKFTNVQLKAARILYAREAEPFVARWREEQENVGVTGDKPLATMDEDEKPF